MSQLDVNPKFDIDLTGVPETLLWNLYVRASEARRPDTVLPDPRAVELVESIDFPFEERFGRVNPLQAQAHALRVRAFDLQVEGFLSRYPDATVVALGEGLETQTWRVDNGQVRWLTVDLPETVRIRRAFLPDSPRQRIVPGSALAEDWLERVDATHAVLITAQGLLMYAQPADVHDLIERCARTFPGGTILFDAMPRWFSRRTLEGKLANNRGYRPPPVPWGVDGAELARVRSLANVSDLREVPLPGGRGLLFRRVVPLMSRIPALRLPPLGFVAPWIILRAEFARADDHQSRSGKLDQAAWSRIASTRRDRFVGRVSELRLFRSALLVDEPPLS